MTDLERLKFYLLEDKFPYFNDTDLENLLTEFTDVKIAAYEGCLIKAQDDSVKLGPISTVSNESFWLRRSGKFRPNHTGTIKRADNV